jgi:hypothetical protein
VHGYSLSNDQADRDLSENATATIAHLASRLALLFVLAEYSLRRPLGEVGVSGNILPANVTNCPCKGNFLSTKGFYA